MLRYTLSPVLTGADVYPENIIEKLKDTVENIKVVKAYEIAESLGKCKVSKYCAFGSNYQSF